MGDMTAVMGNRQAALEVAKEAMQRVARSPYVSAVPGGYPETWQEMVGALWCNNDNVADSGTIQIEFHISYTVNLECHSPSAGNPSQQSSQATRDVPPASHRKSIRIHHLIHGFLLRTSLPN